MLLQSPKKLTTKTTLKKIKKTKNYTNISKIENTKLNSNTKTINYKMGGLDIISQQYIHSNKKITIDNALHKFTEIFNNNIEKQSKINTKEADVNFYVTQSTTKISIE
jgi:hypothetical protein